MSPLGHRRARSEDFGWHLRHRSRVANTIPPTLFRPKDPASTIALHFPTAIGGPSLSDRRGPLSLMQWSFGFYTAESDPLGLNFATLERCPRG